MIEVIEKRSNYIRISIAAGRKINIPLLAFDGEENLNVFLKICKENRSELLENWLKEKEEKKKRNKAKWNVSKVLRISILGFFFGPLGIVFLPFVLSMAKDVKLDLEKFNFDQEHHKKLETARLIAIGAPIFWVVGCLLLFLSII